MPKETSAFLDFVRLVADGDIDGVSCGLAANPAWATAELRLAPPARTRRASFSPSRPLPLRRRYRPYLAAAAFRRPMAELLVAHGGGLALSHVAAHPT